MWVGCGVVAKKKTSWFVDEKLIFRSEKPKICETTHDSRLTIDNAQAQDDRLLTMDPEEEKLVLGGNIPMDITPTEGADGDPVPCNKEMEFVMFDPKEGKLCCGLIDEKRLAEKAPSWLHFPVPADMIFESVRSRLLLLALVFQVPVCEARRWDAPRNSVICNPTSCL